MSNFMVGLKIVIAVATVWMFEELGRARRRYRKPSAGASS